MQLVLTPENDWERAALSSFKEKPIRANIFQGTFYRCAGGWTRQSHSWGGGGSYQEYDSLMLVTANDPPANQPKDENNA